MACGTWEGKALRRHRTHLARAAGQQAGLVPAGRVAMPDRAVASNGSPSSPERYSSGARALARGASQDLRGRSCAPARGDGSRQRTTAATCVRVRGHAPRVALLGPRACDVFCLRGPASDSNGAVSHSCVSRKQAFVAPEWSWTSTRASGSTRLVCYRLHRGFPRSELDFDACVRYQTQGVFLLAPRSFWWEPGSWTLMRASYLVCRCSQSGERATRSR